MPYSNGQEVVRPLFRNGRPRGLSELTISSCLVFRTPLERSGARPCIQRIENIEIHALIGTRQTRMHIPLLLSHLLHKIVEKLVHGQLIPLLQDVVVLAGIGPEIAPERNRWRKDRGKRRGERQCVRVDCSVSRSGRITQDITQADQSWKNSSCATEETMADIITRPSM